MWKPPSLRYCYDTYIRDISIVFLLLLPLTICNAISIFVGHALNISHFPELAKKFFYFSDLLIGIYPSVLCIVTTYYLSSKHSINPMVVVPYAFLMYLSVSLTNGLVADSTGLPNNPLVALVTAIISASCCVSFRLYPLDPSRIDFVKDLYKQVAHFFGFLLLTVALSGLTTSFLEVMDIVRADIDFNPLTVGGGLAYQFILGLLGAIGINGHNFLFGVKQSLYESTQANIAAFHAGEAPLNILGQGFYDAFMQIGGSGNSLSLLLCILLFSKERRHITLALSALPLVMFNINELLLFGLPVIFNPTLIVPFVLAPLVSFVIVYGAMWSGLVNPVEAIVHWMTPPFFSGYVATQNSMSGVFLQIVVVAVGILVYRPFYLHYAGRSVIDSKAMLHQQELEKTTLKSFLGDVHRSMGSYISKHEVSRRVSQMLSKGEFVMFYQPQVHLSNENHLAFESLVRYKDEKGNMLPPIFIKDFTELGAMNQLDHMVIDLVMADMNKMPLTSGCKIGINVCVETISRQGFVEYVAERLDHYVLPASALEIEVTEEAILKDHNQVKRNIDALQALGVKVAIDDFGSGYASFAHLLKFNFDKVKLDRSLLIDAKEERGQNLYQLLAKISDVTGCALVAEGVETEQETAFVKSCGIDICQGYFFAKPLPLNEAIDWAQERTERIESITTAA
ncbi:EAL domain-containing protein [Enterovibrio norvegicus]|uniref:EAL domain-containing protein n=1 Tax=Enterovibrio norvegicus TaxID=188144 RepID=UPI000C817C82|nr:EAL domain-containing protein [Enterovibrio norvegicus]PMN64301.1 diguanylate phosphodiesterase [Enterovibrio norvegicus]